MSSYIERNNLKNVKVKSAIKLNKTRFRFPYKASVRGLGPYF